MTTVHAIAMPSSKTSERLIALRGKATQAEIARVAGVSPASVSNWENGLHSPTLEAVAKLARHWKVTADYIAGLTDHESALPPDSWVVDLDFVDALERRDGSHKKLGAAGAFAVPRRIAVLSSVEYQALQQRLSAAGLVQRENSKRGN